MEYVERAILGCRRQAGITMHDVNIEGGLEKNGIKIYTNSLQAENALKRDRELMQRLVVLQSCNFCALRRAVERSDDYNIREGGGKREGEVFGLSAFKEGENRPVLMARHYGWGNILASRDPIINGDYIGGLYAGAAEGKNYLTYVDTEEGISFYSDSEMIMDYRDLKERGILDDFQELRN